MMLKPPGSRKSLAGLLVRRNVIRFVLPNGIRTSRGRWKRQHNPLVIANGSQTGLLPVETGLAGKMSWVFDRPESRVRIESSLGAAMISFPTDGCEPAERAQSPDGINHRSEHRGSKFCDLSVSLIVSTVAPDQRPNFHGDWRACFHRDSICVFEQNLLR